MTLLTRLTRMKRRTYLPPPQELYKSPFRGGYYHLPDSAKSLAHARRLRAGLPEPLTRGELCQTVLEGLILLSVVVLAAAGGFWLVVSGNEPFAAGIAFTVMCWAFVASLVLVAILLIFSLCRKN